MRVLRRAVLGLTAISVAFGLVSPVAVPAATPAASAATYAVSGGATFNNPNGSLASKYRINDRIKAAIDHAPRGSTIQIMSWNIMSETATDRLLAAQRRGVTVRVLMDAGNWSRKVPNPQFKRLVIGLRRGNASSTHVGTSAAKVCQGTCRGAGGQAHAKYYMFSQTGSSKNVLMQGSANLTTAAAINQWNDLYTWVDSPMYAFAQSIFTEAWADRRVGNPWRQSPTVWRGATLSFAPVGGKYFTAYPETTLLNSVDNSCRNGARRTVIRVFPDVMRGARGLRAAQRLAYLYRRGCDVRVGFTVLSYDAYRTLQAARVPMRHMALDRNRDGQFEKYFHLKVITVNGTIGGQPNQYRTLQGSSNLSDLASASDENIGMFTDSSTTRTYQAQLDYWFAHAARALSYSGRNVAEARALTITPDGTVSGDSSTADEPATVTGQYLAPGTLVENPKTGELVDPYALIDRD